jgi:hypothetical protein
VFCPEGSVSPTPVSNGHYTIGATSQPGHYQTNEDAATRYSQVLCEPGSYCVDGVKYPCPAGTFGETSGLTTPGKREDSLLPTCIHIYKSEGGVRLTRERQCRARDWSL